MLLVYCRAGFEADCAAELTASALGAGVDGRCEYEPKQGYVLWTRSGRGSGGKREWAPEFADLAFARQLVTRCRRVQALRPSDRIPVLVEAARQLGARFSTVWIEAPDADAPRHLLSALRSLTEPLEAALREAGVLGSGRLRARLHVCILDAASTIVGVSDLDNSSPWPMGIPRLRFPAGAPSRSGLKLVEALTTFVGEDVLLERMRAGRVAVDLGAAPGGWSQVLAARGLRVLAVDNGPIAKAVLDTQLVEHRREDAFRFRPERPVDWMFCDVVAAPARIAALVAQWIARGWCRETIFNLKLPNTDRWQEVLRCHGVIERALAKSEDRHALRIKHLYHDREEVTGHLQRL